jgi:hypothetical protein
MTRGVATRKVCYRRAFKWFVGAFDFYSSTSHRRHGTTLTVKIVTPMGT